MSYVNEENELVKIKESSSSKVVSQVSVFGGYDKNCMRF